MVKRGIKATIIILMLTCTFISIGSRLNSNGNEAYATNSGSCSVIDSSGKQIADNVTIQSAWNNYANEQGYTIKLNSDVRLDSALVMGKKLIAKKASILKFDMNGHTIDCQGCCGAFKVFWYGVLTVYNSKYGSQSSAILNSSGATISNHGTLSLNGITISGAQGGAIFDYAWRGKYEAEVSPSLTMKNCTIENCTREGNGAAINATLDGSGPPTPGPDPLTSINDAYFGCTVKLYNTQIKNCRSTAGLGGAIFIAGELTMEESSITNCYAENGGGAIWTSGKCETNVLLKNCKINNNKANDGYAGVITVWDHNGGANPRYETKLSIYGGEMIGNEGDYAGAVYVECAEGGNQVRVGGDFVCTNNKTTSGKVSNIYFKKHAIEKISKIYKTIEFYPEGLTGNAKVGVGFGKSGDELLVGTCETDAIAERTAAHMTADCNSKYQAKSQDEDVLGIYSKPSDRNVYMGKSRKMDLLSFKMVDHPEVKITIDRDKKEVLVPIDFDDKFELWEAEWYAGDDGTARSSTGPHGDKTHPLKSGTLLYSNVESNEDKIILERNGDTQVWKVKFNNQNNPKCKVIVNGGVLPEEEDAGFGYTKTYMLPKGKKVKLVANTPSSDREGFVYWDISVSGGLIRDFKWDYDKYAKETSFTVPTAKDKSESITFTARYLQKIWVNVVNGHLENGASGGFFTPGDKVTVIVNDNVSTFDHWMVTKGYADALTDTTGRRATFKIKNVDSETDKHYRDVTIEAVADTIEKPTAAPKSGKYTGDLDVKLSCATANATIYYSVDNGDWTKYSGKAVSLHAESWKQETAHTLRAYAVLTDKLGRERIRSEIITEKYTLLNPKPIENPTLKINYGYITEDGSREKQLAAGTSVTVKADVKGDGKFDHWEIVQGSLSLTSEQRNSEKMSFRMPNGDLTLEAIYSQSPTKLVKLNVVNGSVDDYLENSDNGSCTITLVEGDHVKVSCNPAKEGYEFSEWTIRGLAGTTSSTDKFLEFDMPGNDVSLTANYINVYDFDYPVMVMGGYQKAEGGRPTFPGKFAFYKANTKVQLTSQYPSAAGTENTETFVSWKVTNLNPMFWPFTLEESYDPYLTFNMPRWMLLISAVTKKTNTHPVTVYEGHILRDYEAEKEASENETSPREYYEPGSNVTVTTKTRAGYRFTGWVSHGINLSNEQKNTETMSFTMPNNEVELRAKYERIPEKYTMITQNGINRLDSEPDWSKASSQGIYAEGSKVSFKAVAPGDAESYEFSKWEIISAPAGYKFDTYTTPEMTIDMPSGNLVLKAVFVSKYKATVLNGTVNGERTRSLIEGKSLWIAADDVDGAVFDHWDCTGIKLSREQMYSSAFETTMPANDIVLKAVYKTSHDRATLVVAQAYIDDDKSKLVGSYGAGTEIKISGRNPGAEANHYYSFDKWVVVEAPSGFSLTDAQKTQETITITMPSGDVKLKAEYIANKYSVYVAHGKADGKRLNQYLDGETVNITADAGAGILFDHWTAIGITLSEEQAGSESFSFKMPENDVSLTAVYKNAPTTVYTLVTKDGVNWDEATTEAKAEASGTYGKDTTVNIKAVAPGPEKAFVFRSWEVETAPTGFKLSDTQKSSQQTTIVMPEDNVVLKAVFERKYLATAVNGTINNEASDMFLKGTKLKVEADIPDGVEFDHWEANGITLSKKQASSYEFETTMPANDITLKAVTKLPSGRSTVMVEQGYMEDDADKTVADYGEGTKIKISGRNPEIDTATLNEVENGTSYSFEKWELVSAPEGFALTAAQEKSETIEISVPKGTVKLRAKYKLNMDTVYVIHGKTDGKNYKKYIEGDTVKVIADAAAGQSFDHWESIGYDLKESQAESESIEFKMPGNDVVLTAHYTATPAAPYMLITECGKNHLSSAEESTAAEVGYYDGGKTVTIEAVNPGKDEEEKAKYQFKYWEIVSGPEGFELSDPSKEKQELTMPAEDLVLNAVYVYKRQTYCIHGTINGETEGEQYEGDELTVKADTAGGLEFDYWEAVGLELTEAQRYSEKFKIDMPDNDIALVAVYVKTPIEPHKLKTVHGLISGEGTKEKDFYQGSQVRVSADIAPGQIFSNWEAEGLSLTEEQSINPDMTIEMPDRDVTLTAVYKNAELKPYELTVINGKVTGPSINETGLYYQDTPIDIKADEIKGYSFKRWLAEGIELTDEQLKSKELSIVMPGNAVRLTAEYDKNPGSNPTPTGDNNRLMLYLAVFISVLGSIAAYTYLKLKK